MIETFDQRIGVLEENAQNKLDLVVEEQQMLGERMDRLKVKVIGVEK